MCVPHVTFVNTNWCVCLMWHLLTPTDACASCDTHSWHLLTPTQVSRVQIRPSDRLHARYVTPGKPQAFWHLNPSLPSTHTHTHTQWMASGVLRRGRTKISRSLGVPSKPQAPEKRWHEASSTLMARTYWGGGAVPLVYKVSLAFWCSFFWAEATW